MLHDPKTSRGLIAEALAVGGNTLLDLADARYRTDVAANDWQAAARDANAYLSAVATEATMTPRISGTRGKPISANLGWLRQRRIPAILPARRR